MVSARPVRVAMAQLFRRRLPYIHHFPGEGQGLARQWVIGIDGGHGLPHLEHCHLPMAVLGMDDGSHAGLLFLCATQMFHRNTLFGIGHAITEGLFRRQGDIQLVAGGLACQGFFQTR